MRYVDLAITFAEFPDEVSLCINISNCPCHCPGCHSSYLAEDIGLPLNKESLFRLIDANQGITCVGLMGGDAAPNTISWLAKCIKEKYKYLKVGWYSGRQELSKDIDIQWFDYIKLGPYIEDKGPLNNISTNQVMYKRIYDINSHDNTGEIDHDFKNITYRFWKTNNF